MFFYLKITAEFSELHTETVYKSIHSHLYQEAGLYLYLKWGREFYLEIHTKITIEEVQENADF